MSANQDSITAAEARRLTDFLIRDDMPESCWILEGAFRWDDSLCEEDPKSHKIPQLDIYESTLVKSLPLSQQ